MLPHAAESVLANVPGAVVYAACENDGGVYPKVNGVTNIVTNFNRNKNLNGKEAILGVYGSALSHAMREKADYVWKMDVDVLLLSGELQRLTEVSGVSFAGYRTTAPRVGWDDARAGMFGCLVGYKVDALQRLLNILSRMPLAKNAPEDLIVSGLANGIGMPSLSFDAGVGAPLGIRWYDWKSPASRQIYSSDFGATAIHLGTAGFSENAFNNSPLNQPKD